MCRTVCLLLAISFVITNLLGCANPTVVEPVQGGDYKMNCTELTTAIEEAKRFKAAAKSKKGFTGGNVARGLLLWPTIFGTYANANEAIRAADTRIVHLSNIRNQKCGNMAESVEPSDTDSQSDSKDELLLWVKVKEENTKDLYEAYLSVYPDGLFAEEAQSKLDELN